MDEVLCNGITITEQFDTGFLCGPYTAVFTFAQEGISYNVSVDQIGIRRLSITSANNRPIKEYLQLFNALDMLLMLADGEFVPVSSAMLVQGDLESSSEKLNDLLNRRLSLFRSADYTQGSHSTFISIEAVLTEDIFGSWLKIREELDILHQMVLYSMADTKLPIDGKCAFIIEAFEALAELINLHNPTFMLPPVRKGESKLGKRLDAIIDKYGQDIFSVEYAKSKNKFIEILVNSRNRLAHIKSKQGRTYMSGSESVLYAVKLSFLYRRVLLELLGVNYSGYQDTLKESIQEWNTWNGILDGFLNKLT